jgi:endoglucanase
MSNPFWKLLTRIWPGKESPKRLAPDIRRCRFEQLEQRTLLTAAWQSDNGNGTFTNPVLYADYPDPDIVRVNTDFYMVSTTFVGSPGINLLHSRDLVNWELKAHVASLVDGGNAYNMIGGTAYQQGYWASSIRYYNGTFYVAANPTFANGRIYYATDPAGPWQYYQLDRGIYDPGLFIDDNGTGYIVCGNTSLTLMTLNSTFSAVVSQKSGFLSPASGAEGSHLVKRGSYYYVFNAVPSVWPYQLLVSRSTDLANGPWTTQVALTETSGGHQGAIVDLPDSTPNTLLDNTWYAFAMQDSGAIGRMTRVGPVFWENDWPIFGTTSSRNTIPATSAKPILGEAIMQPATSDDFGASTLGLQWEWNHNPDNTRWSLTERPGYLRLRPTQAGSFWTARDSLTQKGQGPKSHGVVKFDLSNMQPGDIAGLGTLGKVNANIYVSVDSSGNKTLGTNMYKDGVGSYTGASGVPISGNTIYLRTDMDFVNNLGVCSFSTDGVSWIKLGGNFELLWGYGSTFQGEQYAVFCYNPNTASSTGYVDVDSFTFDGTADLVAVQRARPTLNAARTTFVADDGQLLRGPFTSTEWTSATSQSNIALIKNLGFNAVHLYAESFDPNYPNTGSTAPGYAASRVDSIVASTRNLGLYLIITIGNGAYNGSYNQKWVEDFWTFYAPRYANETHVLFEIQNEPVAWGPPYSSSSATPPGAVAMEVSAYNIIRSYAPNTPVLLFSYAVFGSASGGNAALQDIQAFNTAVFSNPNAVWTNEAVAFHGYAGATSTPAAVQMLLSAGYPAVMTEFAGIDWGGHASGLDVELAAALEKLKISWMTFEYIPPTGVSEDVTVSANFKDLADKAGLAWTPDYGSWPVARGVYGNAGQPWGTTSTFTNNKLTGALRVQAEDFDTGGQGVAYNDTDTANNGGQYRTSEGVDVATTTDTGGGYYVGWTAAGEWLEYTIMVNEPGFYDFGLRYATPNSGTAIRIWANGVDVTGQFTLTSTGSYTTWSTVTRQVFLDYGRQKLRIEIPVGGMNLNWFELTPQAAGALADGTYKLVNRNSGMVMQFDTTTSKVLQQTASGSNLQQWSLVNLGAGQYKVTSAYNGNSWNVWSGYNNTLDLVGWWGVSGKQQRFVVRPIGNGFYRIAPADLGMDFEVAGGSTAGGASVVQNEFKGLNQQQWAILGLSDQLFPTGLTAFWNSSSLAQLSWTAASGAATYSVKRSATSGGPYTTLATGLTGTAFVDGTAVQGTKYYYVVTAVSSGGQESLNSVEACLLNPRALLRFNENTGTTAADATGNGWNGTLQNGAAWATGFSGSAVSLDGTNDYVSLPSGVVNGLSSATVAAWVYLDTVSNWARVFDFGTGTGNYMFLVPKSGATGHVHFAITTGSGEQGIDGAAALSTGVWTHVAVTIANGVGILYVNGVEVGRNSSMTLTPNSLGATTQNYIGKSQWADPYLDGRVDDFRIYDQTLSAGELATIMNSGSATAPTVATQASANPSTVTGTMCSLSVLGADAGGEANLIYTWSTTGAPPAAVAFSVNGTNDAKNTVATFAAAGTYNLQAAITNSSGMSVISSLTVTVSQTLTGVSLSPAVMTVAQGGTLQFAVYGADQFGAAMSSQAATWSVIAGVGSIDANGLFSAPAGGSGLSTVRAITGGRTLYANVSILSQVAWYPANSTSGTTLIDASGNSKDGTLSGAAAFASGVSGNALNLTGGYASLPTGIVSTLSDFTIAAWVKIDTLSSWSRIFDFGTGTTVYMFLTPKNSISNVVRFAITTSGGGGEQQINGTAALTAGSWQHVAVTLSGTTGKLYVNGVLVGTNSSMTLHPSSLGSTTQNYLGDSQYSADAALLASIDDFRIIGRALTVTEVRQFVYPAVSSAVAGSITSASAALSVLGVDATGGESSLTYTWSSTGTPPAPVTFSANGTNAAKNTTATFTKAGTYSFLLTATNAAGFSASSTVSLTIDQLPRSIAISPSGGSQLAVTGTDQFGDALPISAAFAWPAAGLTLQLAGDGKLHLYQSGTTTDVVPPYAAAGLNSATVTGLSAGGQSLTVDLSAGQPIPAGGITFSGGAGGGNSLYLVGVPGGNSVVMSASQITDNAMVPINYSNVTYFGFNLTGGTNSLALNNAPLKINQDNAISAGVGVTIQNGTLDLNGKTDTIGSLLVKSGSVVNGTLYASSYVIESGMATANIVGPGGLQKTTNAQATTWVVSAPSVTVTAGQLTATSINTGTLTLGAGTTLTIAAIPGGPSADDGLIPVAAATVQPVTTESVSRAPVATENAVTSETTSESAVIMEPQPVMEAAAAEAVRQCSAATIAVPEEPAASNAQITPASTFGGTAISTESAENLSDSFSLSLDFDAVAAHIAMAAGLTTPLYLSSTAIPDARTDTVAAQLPQQTPMYSQADSGPISKTAVNWLGSVLARKRMCETEPSILSVSRDESPLAATATGDRQSTSYVDHWLAHSVVLQTVISHPSRNSASNEAVSDVALHMLTDRHAGQLKVALDNVLAEEDDAFVIIMGFSRASSRHPQKAARTS